MSKCLITVEGGLGKNVMFTALMPTIKKHYDEVYVASPYDDVFKACSLVDGAFPFGQANLYTDIALDEDCTVLWREPYSNPRFIKKQCHLFDAWLQELGIDEPNLDYMSMTPILDQIDTAYPQLVKTAEEKVREWGDGKFILVQFCGGQAPLGDIKNTQYDDHKEAIKRNYYKGQELIDKIHSAYPDFKIIHYALSNEPSYEHTEKATMPYLVYHLLAKHAFKVVCTDSSLQHLVTGQCSDTTVIWGETRPEHFGYACNNNICAEHVRNTQPYFRPLGVSPAIVKFPTPAEVFELISQQSEK